MNVMVVGGGGREHAIVKYIKNNPRVEKLFVLPGNGGISRDAEIVNIGAKDIDGIVNFAVENKIDFAIVAPDDPLVLGAVDRLSEKGIKCFGPKKNAAIIEGSKAFSKELMKKYNIPTAGYEIFDEYEKAAAYAARAKTPVVVKADGLALGKGVVICETNEEAVIQVKSMMCDKAFGNSGLKLVIEEFLEGEEVSVLSFTDGGTVIPMVSSQDHKRALDNDKGLNTGGMGAVAPNPFYTDEIAAECMEKIFIPTIRAMKAEGRTFSGCLYFGLMLTKEGPKVIEYNCRFGDPETQVVLPLLNTDLLEIMLSVAENRLNKQEVEFSDKCACCVVSASNGYPLKYEKGFEIKGIEDVSEAEVFVAGAKTENGKLYTNGGRVLGVTAVAPTLREAIAKAYRNSDKINFSNKFTRGDIGARALNAINKRG